MTKEELFHSLRSEKRAKAEASKDQREKIEEREEDGIPSKWQKIRLDKMNDDIKRKILAKII